MFWLMRWREREPLILDGNQMKNWEEPGNKATHTLHIMLCVTIYDQYTDKCDVTEAILVRLYW